MADSWRWAVSESLYLILILPFLAGVAIWFNRQTKKRAENSFGNRITPFLTSSYDDKKSKWRMALELSVLLFMILALARPQAFGGKQKVKKSGVEVLILLDVSNSMGAEDLKPNRLSAAKSELMRFVDQNPNHRYSIVAFAGSAAMVSPLTTDPDATKMFLESLGSNSVSTQGTNLEKALRIAKDSFDRGGEGGTTIASQVTRVIIIVSDGEDQDSAALPVVDELTKDGIKIFTLAAGTEKGAPLPIYDDEGQLRGYRTYNNDTIMSRVNVKFLKDVASRGQGSFHELRIGGEAIGALSSEINILDQSEFGDGEVAIFSERFQIFLIIALSLALVEVLIGNRKPKGRIWRGRFEVMQQ